MNDSSNPLTWITTYFILFLLILFGSDARSAPLRHELPVRLDAVGRAHAAALRRPVYSSSARNATAAACTITNT